MTDARGRADALLHLGRPAGPHQQGPGPPTAAHRSTSSWSAPTGPRNRSTSPSARSCPSTDPTQPPGVRRGDGDTVQVIVLDVTTDEEVARVDVPGHDRLGRLGRAARRPDGDRSSSPTTRPWPSTGAPGRSSRPARMPGQPTVDGGRTCRPPRRPPRWSTSTGRRAARWSRGWLPVLSPDGRYAVGAMGADGVDVHDLDDGGSAVVGSGAVDLRLDHRRPAVQVVRRRLDVCSPATGDAPTSPCRTGCLRPGRVRAAARLHLRELSNESTPVDPLSISGDHRRRTW